MKINVENITERQKLIIKKGLCDYQYIMDNWESDDDDFKAVYYEFYLKARWAVMKKEGNWRPYFEKLQTVTPEDSLLDILEDLKNNMLNHNYELSIGSKLLHTRNSSIPIYDSKIKNYLTGEENVSFWWHGKGAPRGTTEIEKIKHDWNELNNWYYDFENSIEGKQWIEWFDKNFYEYKNISNIKKIDFIIFAVN